MKDILINITLVAAGGGAGSVCRYALSLLAARIPVSGPFPVATFAANVAGCLFIGVVAGLAERYAWAAPHFRLLLGAGFCGGFTTFSTLSLEIVTLAGQNRWAMVALYVLGSMLLGAGAVVAGYKIGNCGA